MEKTSIINKILGFFKSIFSPNKMKALSEKNTFETNSIDKAKNNFWKNVRIEEELEDKELLELQRKVTNKEISLEELTDEQVSNLADLYKRQIERIIRKTEQIEAETEIINAKIARIKGETIEE